MVYYRKEGDTASPIEDKLTDETEGDIPITGATVEITIWPRGEDTATVSDDTTGNVFIDGPNTGEVRYEFQPGDLDTPGVYLYEWTVTYQGGGVETWPSHEAGATLIVTDRKTVP